MADNKKLEVEMMNNAYSPMGPCIPQETVIRDVLLARAYVPYQKFCTLFPPLEALQKGTAFPELFSPYEKKDKKRV
jgi:hypothetical protein